MEKKVVVRIKRFKNTIFGKLPISIVLNIPFYLSMIFLGYILFSIHYECTMNIYAEGRNSQE